MKKNVVCIDSERGALLFYRRFVLNALAILLSDALMVLIALCGGNVLLWLINDIPFAIQNGLLIIPAWIIVSSTARLVPGWGWGVVDELRKVQITLFILFAVGLLISFFIRFNISSSRIVFLITYTLSSILNYF